PPKSPDVQWHACPSMAHRKLRLPTLSRNSFIEGRGAGGLRGGVSAGGRTARGTAPSWVRLKTGWRGAVKGSMRSRLDVTASRRSVFLAVLIAFRCARFLFGRRL